MQVHTSLFILLIDLSMRGKVVPDTEITVFSEPRKGKLINVASSSMISLSFSSFSVMIQSILLPWSTTSFDIVMNVAVYQSEMNRTGKLFAYPAL